jgi:endonuclease-3
MSQSASETEAERLKRLKSQARKVVRQLKQDFPDAACALNFETPFQLLVATILSAQCTDVRVNIVTKDLFAKFPDAESMAAAPLPVLEKLVQSTGFFRNKAKNIKAASIAIVNDHEGELPTDLPSLIALPGVGRKTANVVLGTAFGIPSGVVVDTHVGRLSRRLGLTQSEDAVRVEQDLIRILPRKEWIDYSHRLIYHGRQVCVARRPKCEVCSMARFCPKVGVESR